MVGTVEFLCSKTLKDIDYENLNRVPGTDDPASTAGRSSCARSPRSSDVVLLTNTDEGSQWSVVVKLERPFRNGLYFSASYLYGRAKSINDGTSSQALSNWRFVYVPGRHQQPAAGALELRRRAPHQRRRLLRLEHQQALRHRLLAVLQRPVRPALLRALQHRRQRRRHASATTSSTCPRDVSEVVVTNGTPQQLEAYIAGDDGLSAHRGQIVPRNASRLPWTNTARLPRRRRTCPSARRKLELTMDVLNVLNLIDSEKGRHRVPGQPEHRAHPVRRDRRRQREADLQHRDPGQPDLHQVHHRRPPVALAGPARRPVEILGTAPDERPSYTKRRPGGPTRGRAAFFVGVSDFLDLFRADLVSSYGGRVVSRLGYNRPRPARPGPSFWAPS